ncbi:MAG TPA: LysE family transporter [Bacteroidia bacterium]|nr:LysE family transporter [Bacteroidia bacterium]
MLQAFFGGILLGFTLALLTGPSFFALIQTSIRNGFRSGFALAIGIFISDLLCVTLAYLGASQFFSNPKNKVVEGIVGGIILICFGTYNIFQKHTAEGKKVDELKTINVPLLITKGFFLNILNPFVLFFWVGWMGLISSRFEFSSTLIFTFFSGTLLTVFATDLLKSFSANKIKKFLNHKVLLFVNRISGIILAICGIVLIYRVIL